MGIARALRIPQAVGEEEDAKELIRQYLSASRAGRWLLVVDNADDADIFLGTEQSKGIVDYLPESKTGVVGRVYDTHLGDSQTSTRRCYIARSNGPIGRSRLPYEVADTKRPLRRRNDIRAVR